jgi:NAD(P)-dependent dehydrogenase (short-subunit alcohol dehydrogenase family)
MGIEEDCVRVVEETVKEFGGIDVIISNAVSWPLPSLTPSAILPCKGFKYTNI